MKKLVYIFFVAIIFNSCSEYQKALKSQSIADKFKMGEMLFEEGKYNKANRLFVQIVPKYRGKPQAEKLMYMYSRTFYEMRDYYTANYQFERFVSAYPESEKVEEAAFLAAKSYYHLSPIYTKEQKETIEAIDKLQSFINSYPSSELVAEANVLVKELDHKLEKKAFEIAKQYNKIGPYTRDYQAAIKAFDNFLVNFPGSSFREEAMFYRLDSAYKLAVNSVAWKIKERSENALAFYNQFIKAFPNSQRLGETETMREELKALLENINTKS
ncbi:MAG: outer membrane protein assembly factor BamD [Bacteroidia bacterium]|nr:outer membrane protein assembly factor BamD [Bacteroidia bacterium]NND26337.1 outer membrane protein assembly factor BamD [Flavobacteriaceae bacterium]MBT8278093.1 outer membrane protein assembly factor BamD [Bacteroidia bacterium]NNK59605.1 outer membrane protein assembly factor BamD [Flavobacteriaceae bacterium]NNL33686.1 outer membrane protein assembly factor BamD [Flavobacteriaceae bacterium]